MAVTIEGTQIWGGGTEVSAYNVTYDLPSGTKYMVVSFYMRSGVLSSVEWNGTAMTESYGADGVYHFTLADPDVGNYDLDVTFTLSNGIARGAIWALSGVAAISPVDGTDSDTGTGTSISCAVTATAQGSLGLQANALSSNSLTVAPAGGETELWEGNLGNNGWIQLQYEHYTGTGSKAMTATISSSDGFDSAMLLLKEGIVDFSVSSALGLASGSPTFFKVIYTAALSSALGLSDSITTYAVRTASAVSTIVLSGLITLKDTFYDITNQSKESTSTTTNISKSSNATTANESKATSTMINEANDLI